MKIFGRHRKLWIVGRIGILLAFGIIPLMRACDRIKDKPYWDASTKCHAAFDSADKYPIGSEGWTTNVEAGHYWLGEMKRLKPEYFK